MSHCTHISHYKSSQNLPLQYVQIISSVWLPFSSIASTWTLTDLESLFTLFEASLFPVSCLPGLNNFRFFKDSSHFLLYGEHVSISAELLDRPWPVVLFLKFGMGDISLGNTKSAAVFSVDCEVEGVEHEFFLRAELPATSELKAENKAVCDADSFRHSSAQAQGFCSSVAASKSKCLKIFLFMGRRPVPLKPLVAVFPICTSKYALAKSSDTSYCVTARLFCNC